MLSLRQNFFRRFPVTIEDVDKEILIAAGVPLSSSEKAEYNKLITAQAETKSVDKGRIDYLELETLGVGYHYGEWWGQGIQRGYGLKEKRFSLFNVNKWNLITAPACCHVVPTLYAGMFDTHTCTSIIEWLATYGSVAAPGFMKPEGIVVFHTAQGHLYKKTIEKDESPKGLS